MSTQKKACPDTAISEQAREESVDRNSLSHFITVEGMVSSVLPVGAENALSPDYLCNLLGISSRRKLRREIEEERMAGAVILSNHDRGGYYLPATVEEVEAYMKSMESRAKTTFLSIRSARKLLKELEKQDGKDKEKTIMV